MWEWKGEGYRGSERRHQRVLTDELGDEKAEADPYWRNEIPLVLFCGQHEDREDELRGQNHLYYDTLGDRCSSS